MIHALDDEHAILEAMALVGLPVVAVGAESLVAYNARVLVDARGTDEAAVWHGEHLLGDAEVAQT